jgi:hypothetical protein
MSLLKALPVVAHLHCDLAKYTHNVADRMTIKKIGRSSMPRPKA